MENAVSARRLRKTMLKEAKEKNLSILSDITDINKIKTNKKNIENNFEYGEYDYDRSFIDNEKWEIPKLSFSLKNRLIIKLLLSTLIVFICLVAKLLFPQQAKSQPYIAVLINEYKKDYSKESVVLHLETAIKNSNHVIKYIIPEDLSNKIKNKYNTFLKPYYLTFDLKKEIKKLVTVPSEEEKVENIVETEKKIQEEEKKEEENTGMGGGEPKEEPEILEEASAVSLMQDDISYIKNKNINITLPVSGTLTSAYGARDEIFKGVESYHTGIDIANKLNTQILSATTGIVSKVEFNNKYYGNFVEIETDGVIFKYGHMNEVKVKKGDKIQQGDLVGLMGSTGMSTGSHLHFEIKVDGRTVDPKNFVQI